MTHKTESVKFMGGDGHVLAAKLEVPKNKPKAYMLYAHCFTCTKDIIAAVRISRSLADQGFAVLRFDFTGLGGSDGDFDETNFSTNIDDIEKAADFLRAHYEAPKLMIGHSLGGTAVLAAADKIDECKAVVTIASPSDPFHVASHFGDYLHEIDEQGEACVNVAGKKMKVTKQFIDDVKSQKIEENVKNLKKALLIFHSPLDDVVGIEHAAQLFTWAKHPKSFVSLDEADHLIMHEKDAKFISDVIGNWAVRYFCT